ncbi:MAG: T9SS type A sorting domain-containing protein, partial [Candidatus Margulisbacteria bacterium]|nr:T9SS type A sorting domain-containing protein [Candidatus Margulisiibacteriota bacterium]
MKKLLLLFILPAALLISPAAATTSTPEALVVASGALSGADLSSFSVLGENTMGVISGANSTVTVGLASVIYTPLVAQTGVLVPIVATAETSVISYPNPFNPNLSQSVTVAYKLSSDVGVKVYIFDVTGQLVRQIAISSANRGPDGLSRVSWDGRSGFGE